MVNRNPSYTKVLKYFIKHAQNDTKIGQLPEHSIGTGLDLFEKNSERMSVGIAEQHGVTFCWISNRRVCPRSNIFTFFKGL